MNDDLLNLCGLRGNYISLKKVNSYSLALSTNSVVTFQKCIHKLKIRRVSKNHTLDLCQTTQ